MEKRGLWNISIQFKAMPQGEIIWRASTTGTNIEELMTAGQMGEALVAIQRWYCQANEHPTPLTRDRLENT